MCEELELGFWDTLEACRGLGLSVDHKDLPSLRLFYSSGVQFASTSPQAQAWRQQVRRVANQHRPQPDHEH